MTTVNSRLRAVLWPSSAGWLRIWGKECKTPFLKLSMNETCWSGTQVRGAADGGPRGQAGLPQAHLSSRGKHTVLTLSLLKVLCNISCLRPGVGLTPKSWWPRWRRRSWGSTPRTSAWPASARLSLRSTRPSRRSWQSSSLLNSMILICREFSRHLHWKAWRLWTLWD